MSAVLELPKFTHPDFTESNKRPVGPFEIDWGSEATKGLSFCLDPLTSLEMVSGIPLAYADTGTPVIKGGYLSCPDGSFREFTTNSDWSGTSYTILIMMRVNGADANYGGVWAKNSVTTTSQIGMGRDGTGGSYYIGHNNGAQGLADFGFTADLGHWVTHVYRWDGTTFEKWVRTLTGENQYDSVAYSTAVPTGTANLLLGVDRAGSTSFDSDVDFRLVCFFKNEFKSEATINALLDNPYRELFKPVVPLYYSAPSEAAGGTGVVRSIAGQGGIAGEGGIAGKHGGIAG